MSKILIRIGYVSLAVLVLLICAVVAARIWFNHYLHSEAFRKSLGDAAAKSLHAKSADFAPLDFDGASVFSNGFKATREDGGGFSTLDADQIRASFDWHGLLSHTVQIDEMSVQQLDIEPPTPASAGEETAPAESTTGESAAPAPLSVPTHGWTVDLRKAVVSRANWHWGGHPDGGITGASLSLTPDGSNAWLIDAQGGTMTIGGGWPALDLDSASMRWQAPALYINSASLRNGSSRFTVTGQVETRESAQLQVKFDTVDMRPMLTPDWRERLGGVLTGTANIEAPLNNGAASARDLKVSGSMSLLDGKLTALPILDEIGTFTHTERFRQLDLTHASASFSRNPDRLDVTDLIVEAEGLIRLEGSFTVINGQIDGHFHVGLTPATLQWIPGSQEEIFTDSHGGYQWTPMALTGPASHPTDDLTPRLIAATGNAVIHEAKGVEDAAKKAGESLLDILTH